MSQSRKEFSRYKARMANEMTDRLAINSQRRQYRQKREMHEKLGLPWPPPPPPPEEQKEKQSRKKREEKTPKLKPSNESTRRKERERTIRRIEKPRAKSIEPVYAKKDRIEKDRIRSAEDELTEFKKAQFEKNILRQTGYSHALVEEWGYEASAKAKAAQAATKAAAEAAIKARTDLVSADNTEGEATLRSATEAAIRAEAELARSKTYAEKFKSVDRMRTKLKEKGMAEMEEEQARRMRETDKKFVIRAVQQISLRASGYGRDVRKALEKIDLRAPGHDREARSPELIALEKKWSQIEVIARSLETSVEDTNEADTKRIITHLGAARTMIENTSADNRDEADKIIKELYKAQAIGIREIASSRPRPRPAEAGLRRTKKHTRKHKKKRDKTSKAKH